MATYARFLLAVWRLCFGSSDGQAAEQERLSEAKAELLGRGFYRVAVAGTADYQTELTWIAGGRKTEAARLQAAAVLVLETDNPDDPQAVAVKIKHRTIGHLRRADARRYGCQLRRLGFPELQAAFPAMVAWDGEHFAVRVDMAI